MAELVIFARAPRLGSVKTRLAADIGDEAAFEFYVETLNSLMARLANDPRWSTCAAVTPDEGVDDLIFRVPGICATPQGEGDLGARLQRFLARATRARPVMVISSDAPELGREHIAEAIVALSRHDLALGPCPDGGYWLIGAGRPPPPALFKGVRWSTEHARADTMARAGACSVALLTELEDVDDGASYARWRGRLT